MLTDEHHRLKLTTDKSVHTFLPWVNHQLHHSSRDTMDVRIVSISKTVKPSFCPFTTISLVKIKRTIN